LSQESLKVSKVEIKVPSVGESVTEGVLSRWLKKSGEAVKSGDPLFELETDKASNEVPALAAGVLTTSVAEGETVQIGAIVCSIDTSAVAASAPTPAACGTARRTKSSTRIASAATSAASSRPIRKWRAASAS